MITNSNCIKEYRKQFPKDDCAFNEPGNGIFIIAHDSGKCFISPFSETDNEFMKRLDRCKSEGRNLFYEEWDTLSYENGNIY